MTEMDERGRAVGHATGRVLSPLVLVAALALTAVAARAENPSAFIRKFRADMVKRGDTCELRHGDLLCMSGADRTIMVYATSDRASVGRAHEAGPRTYCAQLGEREMATGFVHGRGFARNLVLSASVTATDDLVCVISYAR